MYFRSGQSNSLKLDVLKPALETRSPCGRRGTLEIRFFSSGMCLLYVAERVAAHPCEYSSELESLALEMNCYFRYVLVLHALRSWVLQSYQAHDCRKAASTPQQTPLFHQNLLPPLPCERKNATPSMQTEPLNKNHFHALHAYKRFLRTRKYFHVHRIEHFMDAILKIVLAVYIVRRIAY